MLPAVAVAADAVVRRWRWCFPIAIGLLVVGIPGNINAIRPTGRDRLTLGNEAGIVALARSPYATEVSRSSHPIPRGAPQITVGWLLDGVKSGRVPSEPVAPAAAAQATLGLVLVQSNESLTTRDCKRVSGPVTFRLDRGDALVIRGAPAAVHVPLAGGRLSAGRVFQPLLGSTIRIEAGPVTFVVTRNSDASGLVVCRGV